MYKNIQKNIVQVTIMDEAYIIRMNIEFTPKELFDEIFAQASKEKWVILREHLKNLKSTSRNVNHLQTIKNRTEHIKPITKTDIPNYMCFYSDLIKPQIFGNVMARGMLMHPVKYNK